MVAATAYGLSFAEAAAMAPYFRKAFIYSRSKALGCDVDWNTGSISAPKQPGGGK